ncbi:MAG: damage-inducible protein DinB [Alphaproteobacteria bacterium]|nr:damage-inducible protein DinB [Alphaproteobacteria bacterium]MBV8413274.1 damage-inducible protein DinB [Alphaproteobacteria bacterium]
MREHYTSFAGYNAWANQRLYEAAAALSDAEYRADRGAFFKSMHGTLNHLLVTDRIWLQRFTGEGSAPDRLDAILHERLDALRTAREAEDRRIVDWIGSLDDSKLQGVIRYRRVSTPEAFVQPLMPALDHWFNHQTHHRGQAHMILTSLGKMAPELDLLYYQRLVAAERA